VQLAVLVPVKAFHAAKARLAGWIPDADRARLAQWMAEQVLNATTGIPTFVACDDDDVAAWAESRGAGVVWGPGLGLNGAIDHGIDILAGKGADHVTITHGDLPLSSALPDIARPGEIVIVPDRRRAGTNVLSRPTAISLRAEYGAGSYQRHLAAALLTTLPVTVRSDSELSLDVDTIDDCRHPLVAPVLRPVIGSAFDR